METIPIHIATTTNAFEVRERLRDLVEEEYAAEDVVSAAEDDRIDAMIPTMFA